MSIPILGKPAGPVLVGGKKRSLDDCAIFTEEECDAMISGTDLLIEQLMGQATVPWEVLQGAGPTPIPLGQLFRTVATLRAYRDLIRKMKPETEAAAAEVAATLDPRPSFLRDLDKNGG